MRTEKTENLQDKETKTFLEENLGETFDEDMQMINDRMVKRRGRMQIQDIVFSEAD